MNCYICIKEWNKDMALITPSIYHMRYKSLEILGDVPAEVNILSSTNVWWCFSKGIWSLTEWLLRYKYILVKYSWKR